MRLRLLTLLASILLLNSCGGLKGVRIGNYNLDPLISASQKVADAQEVSEPAEIDIGTHMAATLVGTAPLDNDETAQRYINRLGRMLAMHSSRPQLPWKFGVLNDQDINAFAAPGGYVFVTRGMLAQLESEAELAGVLAHEIAHIEQKHHLKAMQKDNLTGAAADIFGAVSDHQIAKSGGRYSGLKKDASDKIVGASRVLYARGLDRDDELAADNRAIALLNSAGYDAWAFVAVLQKLEARQSGDAGMALLLKTHPSPATRISAISQQSLLASLDAQGQTLSERFRKNVK